MERVNIVAAGLLATAIGTAPALAQQSSFGPSDAKEVYYWVSNKANLPLFVQYDYVGMKRIADELHVQVRVAGPTDFDLPGFIAAVDQVCAQKPAGVSVVGGWDPSLTEAVNKCIAAGVPTVVDDAAKAAEVTAALLAAHPDLAAIAGFDSESGSGIVRALQEAGKKPGDVVVTAMEQTPDFFKTAKEGWTEAVIVQNRELFIYYAVKMLYDFKHNGLKTSGLDAAHAGVPIPPTLDTGVLAVTKANVDGVLSALQQ